MKRLLTLLLVLVTATTSSAQITIPNTFSPNTVAQSALVNANFSQVGALALNRAGGNVTGNITADGGVTIDGVDIGATVCVTCDPTFDDVTVDTLTAVTATLSGALNAASIDVTGGIQAGSGNVDIIDSSGRIPAISSTYFASLSGANLTGITEAAITDSTILARVAANETISGQWTFSNSILGPSGAQATPSYSFSADTNTGIYLASADVLTVVTGGVAHAGWIENGNFRHNRGVIFPSVLSPSTLASGNNNNYNPTGLDTAVVLNLTGHASNSTLTGITASETGRVLYVCDSDGGGTITIAHEDTNSTAANRFDLGVTIGSNPRLRTASTGADYPGPCMHFMYFNSRWTLIGSAPLGS